MLVVLALAHAADIETFHASAGVYEGRGGLQVGAPDLGDAGAIYGGAALVYAANSVVYDDGTPLVPHRVGVTLAAGYTLLGAARLEAELPLYPLVTYEDQAGGAIGDLELGATVPVLRRAGAEGLAAAVRPGLALPTGTTGWFAGSGSVGGSLAATAAYGLGGGVDLGARVGLGAAATTGVGDQGIGSAVELGLGGSFVPLRGLRVGAELDGDLGLSGTARSSPFDVHAYATYGSAAGVHATALLGTGVVAGVGAPAFRGGLAVGYALAGRPPVRDRDADGVADPADACPDAAEDADAFEDGDGCPELDNDRDGIADAEDRCPSTPEDADRYEDEDGCPESDNDADGVGDPDDRCPVEPGPAATGGCPDGDADGIADAEDRCASAPGIAALQGCPDADGDGVPDHADACPGEPREPGEDPARSDGCPKRVFVSLERIEVKETIHFDSGRATIRPLSYPLLDEVGAVLEANPDLRCVEVAGHTDARGDDARNLALSRDRAAAVVGYLVARAGVASGRLSPVGYGETLPIDTNATDTGRARNRRVEFVVRECGR